MKFYRVKYMQDGGNSAGFSWHTNRAEAVCHARSARREDPDEYDGIGPSLDQMISEWTMTPTKAGILAFLRLHADHPDNG